MIDTERKVKERMMVIHRRMMESVEESERRVAGQRDPVIAISDVLDCVASGLRNSITQTITALNYIQDERTMLRYLLTDIVGSLPEKREWLNPETEKWARYILKTDPDEREA